MNVNGQIKAHVVRLVTDDGNQKILSLRDALNLARDAELDLVQFSEGNPPTVKIINYSKYKFTQQKKKKEAEKKSRSQRVEIKELQFRPVTDQNDLNRLINQANKFIEQGNKVKFVCKFKGRENMFKSAGLELLNQIIEKVSGSVEGKISHQDRNISVIIS